MRSVVVAARSDEDAIASVMTLAFANDPAARRLYPDPFGVTIERELR